MSWELMLKSIGVKNERDEFEGFEDFPAFITRNVQSRPYRGYSSVKVVFSDG